jgi:hypothetical protein
MWRCPHCGAPQAETARCWVCRRSSTTCSTCIHFRRALAGDLGYCALDPRRRPLTGRELRGCWEGRAEVAPPQPTGVPVIPLHRLRAPAGRFPGGETFEAAAAMHRDFVPLDTMIDPPAGSADSPTEADGSMPPAVIEQDPDWAERTSLFGDASRRRG